MREVWDTQVLSCSQISLSMRKFTERLGWHLRNTGGFTFAGIFGVYFAPFRFLFLLSMVALLPKTSVAADFCFHFPYSNGNWKPQTRIALTFFRTKLFGSNTRVYASKLPNIATHPVL